MYPLDVSNKNLGKLIKNLRLDNRFIGGAVTMPYKINILNLLDNVDYIFLGAWNFKEVIANKESEFVENGGKFITHVPEVMEFN